MKILQIFPLQNYFLSYSQPPPVGIILLISDYQWDKEEWKVLRVYTLHITMGGSSTMVHSVWVNLIQTKLRFIQRTKKIAKIIFFSREKFLHYFHCTASSGFEHLYPILAQILSFFITFNHFWAILRTFWDIFEVKMPIFCQKLPVLISILTFFFREINQKAR